MRRQAFRASAIQPLEEQTWESAAANKAREHSDPAGGATPYPILKNDRAFTRRGIGRLQVCWQSMLQ